MPNTGMLLVLILGLCSAGVHATKIRLYNGCPFTVWPAWLPNADKPHLEPGGTQLNPWESYDVYASTNWAGRFWGRTKCRFGVSSPGCETGDCNGKLHCNTSGQTPATIVQFAFHTNNVDSYSVSVVDGYNLPIRVSTSHPRCEVAGCNNDVNINCPAELAVRNTDGYVIACKSACLAFNEDKYCCSNEFDNPRCPTNFYADKFKDSCPAAATYKYDKIKSSFTCASGTDFTVTFCPGATAGSAASLLDLKVFEDI